MKTWNPDDTRWKAKWEELKLELTKHQAGKHDQKTHGRGGMGAEWSKGEWHTMSNKDYIKFISETNRLAQGKSERREISKTEWKKDYAKTDEEYLADKPTRVYKNGGIVVFSQQSDSEHHTSLNETSFLRDVDDLQEKYPVDQLVIRIGDDINSVADNESWGATVRGGTGGSMMWIKGDSLNPNQMRQGPHSMEAQFKTGIRTYILTHEWGHAIDRPNLESSNYGERDNLINSFVSAEYGGVRGTNLMSIYGNSEPSEAFAEAFVDYVVGQDRKQPSTNPLVNIMAERFGWDKPWKK